MEKWKVIKLCPKYSISSFGRVKRRKTERILKGCLSTNLYLHVNICGKTTYIHKLVAHHFIGLQPKNKIIDHLDGNRSNNEISNLRYISQSENVRNRHAYGDIVVLTIRIPPEVWKQLRRLQEERKIKSIQDAVMRGLKMVIEKK